ncbi:MAG: hypothetical protein ABGX04_00720 [Myxococcales bacterium]|nr:hypothetical protein [Myxococcales bacterium]HIK85697.1 hypothetical protein [Myxococcales bacterium]
MRGSGGLFLAAVMCLSVSCVVRSSTLALVKVTQEQWYELNASIATVAEEFGFRSDASQYFDHDTSVGEGWLVIASYSNQGGGSEKFPGGRAHVEFSVFARPELRIAEITIIDYTNSFQTEYLHALEDAIEEELHQSPHIVRADWIINVVRTLPP